MRRGIAMRIEAFAIGGALAALVIGRHAGLGRLGDAGQSHSYSKCHNGQTHTRHTRTLLFFCCRAT